jgi:hypothetical protein
MASSPKCGRAFAVAVLAGWAALPGTGTADATVDCGLEPGKCGFRGNLEARGAVSWAETSFLSTDQGGAIELGNSLGSGTIPYIDFHFGIGMSQDYNMRLINSWNGVLAFDGGALGVGTPIPVAPLDVAGFGAFSGQVAVRGGDIEGGQVVLNDKGILEVNENVGSWNIDSIGDSPNALFRIFRSESPPALTIDPTTGEMVVDGAVRSNGPGFVFPDGSLQTTALATGLNGPRGPEGPPGTGPAGLPGAPGAANHTVAVCAKDCSCGLSMQTIVTAAGPCTVSSSTGACKGAEGGKCCVCRP